MKPMKQIKIPNNKSIITKDIKMKKLNEKQKENLIGEFFSTYEKNPPIGYDDLYDWLRDNKMVYMKENFYGFNLVMKEVSEVMWDLITTWGKTDLQIINEYKKGGYEVYKNEFIPMYQLNLTNVLHITL